MRVLPWLLVLASLMGALANGAVGNVGPAVCLTCAALCFGVAATFEG